MAITSSLLSAIIKQVVPLIIEKIGNKISPDELQRAIEAGIEAAEAEEESLSHEQHLFFKSKPDGLKGVPAFLENFFKRSGVQTELAKPFNNEGLPDVSYLAEEFNKVAESFKEVKPVADRVKPWLTTFTQTYFKETNYLRFKVAKENYFKQLNKRYDDIKFAGIAVSGQEERKQLKQIFVMPDVVERENKQPFPNEFIDEGLTPQQRLILEQKQLASLSNTFSTSLLANKLLTETRSKKAVILGAPGSGKSTLVSYFAVMLEENAKDLGLDSDTDWLPIVVEIRDFERYLQLNFLDYLHQFAESNLTTNKLPEDFFKHWLERGKALILLDGIDEVAQTDKRYRVVERIESFLHQYNRNITIITSRPSGYRKDFFSTTEFPHYHLQPFDDEKIEQFINHWYDSRIIDPQEAARCKDSLRKALADNDRIKLLAKNPLLITIIALIHRYQAYLPKERHKLYDRAVETLLTSWDANKAISGHKVLKYLDLDDLRRLLESLARWIHSQGSTGDKEGGTQIDKDELLEWLGEYIKTNKQRKLHEAREEAKRFLNFIRERTGLLNEQGTDRYAFVHKTFQEYLCAQDINYKADDEDDFEIILNCIKKHLHDPHWREVLLLLVALQKPKKALKAIKAIYENNSQYEQWLHRDLLFAGSCLADSSKGIAVRDREGLAEKILNDLINLEVADKNRIGSKVSQQVFEVLTSFVETEWEAEALKIIKENKSKIDRFRFIKYQAALGETEQAKPLLSLLQDDKAIVRCGAAIALGAIDEDEPQTVEVWLIYSPKSRSTMVQVLGKIGQGKPQVAKVLLFSLQDNVSEMICFIKTSEKIGKDKPRIIKTLLFLLQDDDSEVRSAAVDALGNIGKNEPEVIEALLALLQDNNSEVRSAAVDALGKIGKNEPEVIEALLPLLQDNNSKVRSAAVDALGEIGKSEPKVIEALLPLLKDSDFMVRSAAADAIGNIGKSEPELINLMTNWIEQHQNTEYVGNGIDVLWNLVADLD